MLSSISKSLRGTVIGVALVLVSSAAGAVPVAVTYGISSITYFSPAANANVLYGTGSLTVTFMNATSGLHVGAGSLHVASGTLMLNNTVSLAGGAIMLTGMQQVVFPGSGMGNVTSMGLFNLATVGHIASGMLHCAGAFCGLAGFVSSAPVSLTSGLQGFNLNGLLNALLGFPSVGPQNFVGASGTGGMTPQGGTFMVTVTGQEVSRQIVPEPGTGALLGLGLAGLGIVMTTLRRRRS